MIGRHNNIWTAENGEWQTSGSAEGLALHGKVTSADSARGLILILLREAGEPQIATMFGGFDREQLLQLIGLALLGERQARNDAAAERQAMRDAANELEASLESIGRIFDSRESVMRAARAWEALDAADRAGGASWSGR